MPVPTPTLSPAAARRLLRPLFRIALHPRLPFVAQRRILELLAPVQRCPAGTVTRRTVLAGRPVERVTVGATERRAAVLYLHGGAYTAGSPATHRSLAAHLAAAADAAVYVLDYRLAPEHRCPAAVEDATAAYLELVTEQFGADSAVALAGDSAGGGLAVATAVRLRDRHGVSPAALGLLSPWTDPSAALPFYRDVVINAGWTSASCRAYLGDGDPTDPDFAPMYADLAGLPATLVQVATTEALYRQVCTFASKLGEAGVDTTLVEQPELWHVAPLQASLVPEAAAAIADFGRFLRDHTRPSTGPETSSRA